MGLGWRARITENFGGERLEGGSLLPGVGREAGFAAGLLKEGQAIPAVLDRNLGQEEAAVQAEADHQTMPADLDLIGSDG